MHASGFKTSKSISRKGGDVRFSVHEDPAMTNRTSQQSTALRNQDLLVLNTNLKIDFTKLRNKTTSHG